MSEAPPRRIVCETRFGILPWDGPMPRVDHQYKLHCAAAAAPAAAGEAAPISVAPTAIPGNNDEFVVRPVFHLRQKTASCEVFGAGGGERGAGGGRHTNKTVNQNGNKNNNDNKTTNKTNIEQVSALANPNVMQTQEKLPPRAVSSQFPSSDDV